MQTNNRYKFQDISVVDARKSEIFSIGNEGFIIVQDQSDDKTKVYNLDGFTLVKTINDGNVRHFDITVTSSNVTYCIITVVDGTKSKRKIYRVEKNVDTLDFVSVYSETDSGYEYATIAERVDNGVSTLYLLRGGYSSGVSFNEFTVNGNSGTLGTLYEHEANNTRMFLTSITYNNELYIGASGEADDIIFKLNTDGTIVIVKSVPNGETNVSVLAIENGVPLFVRKKYDDNYEVYSIESYYGEFDNMVKSSLGIAQSSPLSIATTSDGIVILDSKISYNIVGGKLVKGFITLPNDKTGYIKTINNNLYCVYRSGDGNMVAKIIDTTFGSTDKVITFDNYTATQSEELTSLKVINNGTVEFRGSDSESKYIKDGTVYSAGNVPNNKSIIDISDTDTMLVTDGDISYEDVVTINSGLDLEHMIIGNDEYLIGTDGTNGYLYKFENNRPIYIDTLFNIDNLSNTFIIDNDTYIAQTHNDTIKVWKFNGETFVFETIIESVIGAKESISAMSFGTDTFIIIPILKDSSDNYQTESKVYKYDRISKTFKYYQGLITNGANMARKLIQGSVEGIIFSGTRISDTNTHTECKTYKYGGNGFTGSGSTTIDDMVALETGTINGVSYTFILTNGATPSVKVIKYNHQNLQATLLYTSTVSSGTEISFLEVYGEPMLFVNGTLYSIGTTKLEDTGISYLHSGDRKLITIDGTPYIVNRRINSTSLSKIINNKNRLTLNAHNPIKTYNQLASLKTQYNIGQSLPFEDNGESFVFTSNSNSGGKVYKLVDNKMFEMSTVAHVNDNLSSIVKHNGETYLTCSGNDTVYVYKWDGTSFTELVNSNITHVNYCTGESIDGKLYIVYGINGSGNCTVKELDNQNTLVDVTSIADDYGYDGRLVTIGSTSYLLISGESGTKILTFDGTSLSNSVDVITSATKYATTIVSENIVYIAVTDSVNQKAYIYTFDGTGTTLVSTINVGGLQSVTLTSIKGIIFVTCAGSTTKVFKYDNGSSTILKSYSVNENSKQLVIDGNGVLLVGTKIDDTRRIVVDEYNTDDSSQVLSTSKIIGTSDWNGYGRDIQFFNIGDDAYMVYANDDDRNAHVMKYTNNAWLEIQLINHSNKLPARGDFITYNNEHLLAMSFFDGDGSDGQGVCSYRWDGTQFVQFFYIDINVSYNCKFYTTDNGLYLIPYESQYNDVSSYSNDGYSTRIFKYDGSAFNQHFKFDKAGCQPVGTYSQNGIDYVVLHSLLNREVVLCKINENSFSNVTQYDAGMCEVNIVSTHSGDYIITASNKANETMKLYKLTGISMLEVDSVSIQKSGYDDISYVINGKAFIPIKTEDNKASIYTIENGKLKLFKEFNTNVGIDGAIGVGNIDNKLMITYDTKVNNKRVLNISKQDVKPLNEIVPLVENKPTSNFEPKPLELKATKISDNYNIDKPETNYDITITNDGTMCTTDTINIDGIQHLIYGTDAGTKIKIASYVDNVATTIQTLSAVNDSIFCRSSAVKHSDEYFITIAHFKDDTTLDSHVYRWDGTQFVSIFAINDFSYDMAIGSTDLGLLCIAYNNSGTDTTVYKYDGTTFIDMGITVPGINKTNSSIFSFNGETFIISNTYGVDAWVYKVTDTSVTKVTQIYNNEQCALTYNILGKDLYVFVTPNISSGEIKTFKYDGTSFILKSTVACAGGNSTSKQSVVYNGEIYVPRVTLSKFELFKLVDDTLVSVMQEDASSFYGGLIFMNDDNGLVVGYGSSATNIKLKTLYFKDERKSLLNTSKVNNVTNMVDNNKFVKQEVATELPNDVTYSVSIRGESYVYVNDTSDLKEYKHVNDKLVLNKVYTGKAVSTMSFAKDNGEVYCVMLFANNEITANHWDGTEFVETNSYSLANPYTPIFGKVDNVLSIITTSTDGNVMWYKLDNNAFPNTSLTGSVSITINSFKATTKADGTCLLLCTGTSNTNIVSLAGTTLTIEQTIDTASTTIDTFKIDNKDFFIIGAYNSKKYSTLYMSVNDSFVEVQKLYTPIANDIKHFVHSGVTYLAVSSNKSTSIKAWNGYKFVHYQTVFSAPTSKTAVIQNSNMLKLIVNKTSGLTLYDMKVKEHLDVADIDKPVDVDCSISASITDGIRLLDKHIMPTINNVIVDGGYYKYGGETFLHTLGEVNSGSVFDETYRLVNGEFVKINYIYIHYKIDCKPTQIGNEVYIVKLDKDSDNAKVLDVYKHIGYLFVKIASYKVPNNKQPTRALIYEHNGDINIIYSGGDSVAETVKLKDDKYIIHIENPSGISNTKIPLAHIKTNDNEFIIIGGDELGKRPITANGTLGDYTQEDASPCDSVGVFEFLGGTYLVHNSYGSSTESKIMVKKYESPYFYAKSQLVVPKTATDILVSEYNGRVYLYTSDKNDVTKSSSLYVFAGTGFVKYKNVDRKHRILQSSTIIDDAMYVLSLNADNKIVTTKVVNVTKQNGAKLSIFGRNNITNELKRLSVVIWSKNGVAQEIGNIQTNLANISIVSSYTVNDSLSYVAVVDNTQTDYKLQLFSVSNGKLTHEQNIKSEDISSVSVIQHDSTVYIAYISAGKLLTAKIRNNVIDIMAEQTGSTDNSNVKLIKYMNNTLILLCNKGDKTVVSVFRNNKIIQNRLVINNTADKTILWDTYDNDKSIKGLVTSTNSSIFDVSLSSVDITIPVLDTTVSTQFSHDDVKNAYGNGVFSASELPNGITLDTDGTVHGAFTETGQGTMYITDTLTNGKLIVPYSYMSAYKTPVIEFNLSTSGNLIVDTSDTAQVTQTLTITKTNGDYSSGKVIKDGVELATLTSSDTTYAVDLNNLVDNMANIKAGISTETITLEVKLVDANDDSEHSETITYDVGCKPKAINTITANTYTNIGYTIDKTKNSYPKNDGYTISGNLPVYMTVDSENQIVINSATLHDHESTVLAVNNKYGSVPLTIDTSTIDKVEFTLQQGHEEYAIENGTTELTEYLQVSHTSGSYVNMYLIFDGSAIDFADYDDGISFNIVNLIQNKDDIVHGVTEESAKVYVSTTDKYGEYTTHDVTYYLGAKPWLNGEMPILKGRVNIALVDNSLNNKFNSVQNKTYNIPSLPAGLSVADVETGRIEGTPTEESTGELMVNVSNDYGTITVQTYYSISPDVTYTTDRSGDKYIDINDSNKQNLIIDVYPKDGETLNVKLYKDDNTEVGSFMAIEGAHKYTLDTHWNIPDIQAIKDGTTTVDTNYVIKAIDQDNYEYSTTFSTHVGTVMIGNNDSNNIICYTNEQQNITFMSDTYKQSDGYTFELKTNEEPPSGLTLNADTGVINGASDAESNLTFHVTITNLYGSFDYTVDTDIINRRYATLNKTGTVTIDSNSVTEEEIIIHILTGKVAFIKCLANGANVNIGTINIPTDTETYDVTATIQLADIVPNLLNVQNGTANSETVHLDFQIVDTHNKGIIKSVAFDIGATTKNIVPDQDIVGTVGTEVNFTWVTDNYKASDGYSFTAVDIPSFLTLDTANGNLKGIPSSVSNGDCKVSVINKYGSFILDIHYAITDTLVVTGDTAPAFVYNDEETTYTVTTSGQNVQNVTFTNEHIKSATKTNPIVVTLSPQNNAIGNIDCGLTITGDGGTVITHTNTIELRRKQVNISNDTISINLLNGTNFDKTYTIENSSPDATIEITNGTLPNGMNVDINASNNLHIYGTPNVDSGGVVNVTVKVTAHNTTTDTVNISFDCNIPIVLPFAKKNYNGKFGNTETYTIPFTGTATNITVTGTNQAISLNGNNIVVNYQYESSKPKVTANITISNAIESKTLKLMFKGTETLSVNNGDTYPETIIRYDEAITPIVVPYTGTGVSVQQHTTIGNLDLTLDTTAHTATINGTVPKPYQGDGIYIFTLVDYSDETVQLRVPFIIGEAPNLTPIPTYLPLSKDVKLHHYITDNKVAIDSESIVQGGTPLPTGLQLSVEDHKLIVSGNPTAIGSSNVHIAVTNIFGSETIIVPISVVKEIDIQEIQSRIYTTVVVGNNPMNYILDVSAYTFTNVTVDSSTDLSVKVNNGNLELTGTPNRSGGTNIQVTLTNEVSTGIIYFRIERHEIPKISDADRNKTLLYTNGNEVDETMVSIKGEITTVKVIGGEIPAGLKVHVENGKLKITGKLYSKPIDDILIIRVGNDYGHDIIHLKINTYNVEALLNYVGSNKPLDKIFMSTPMDLYRTMGGSDNAEITINDDGSQVINLPLNNIEEDTNVLFTGKPNDDNSTPPTGDIHGAVVITNRNDRGGITITATINNITKSTHTAPDGTYSISEMPVGSVLVTVYEHSYPGTLILSDGSNPVRAIVVKDTDTQVNTFIYRWYSGTQQ